MENPFQTKDVRWAPPGNGLRDAPNLRVHGARVHHVGSLRALGRLPQAARQIVGDQRLVELRVAR
eukprot:8377634-Pyramimonas_sp.AAC.1